VGALSQRWKRIIRRGIAGVLLLNVALVLFLWRGGAAAPEIQRAELDRLKDTHAFLSADVGRAQRISDSLPAISRGADQFLAGQFLPLSTGYSQVVEDLGKLAGKAGLSSSGIAFRQREVRGRNLYEVELATTVEGDYASTVKFVNSLERSDNFYLIDELTLTTTPQGAIKMYVRLKTYFGMQG